MNKIEARNELVTHLGSCNRVSVGKWGNGKCKQCRMITGHRHKICRKRKVISIFIDDGSPKMSRYWGDYCKEHLPKAIQSGWERNDKNWIKIQKNV